MNATHHNILSRIKREYVSFLYDITTRISNQPVTITEIQEFIKTPEGQKGLMSFKAMSMQRRLKQQSAPKQIGAFL